MRQWIGMLGGSTSFQAHLALLEIGPAAVPYLFKEFEKEKPLWDTVHSKYVSKLPVALSKHLPAPPNRIQRRVAAAGVLREMGPAANSAVPAFTRALKHPNLEIARSGAFALEYIMPDNRDAIAALVDAVKRNANSNSEAVMALHAMIFQDRPSVDAAIPGFIEMLSPNSSQTRLSIDLGLRLIQMLGAMGEKAVAAEPILTELASEKKSPFHGAAEIALWQIVPEKYPARQRFERLAEMLRDQNQGARSPAFHYLNWRIDRLGPEAAPLVPAIINLLARTKPDWALLEVVEKLGPLATPALPQIKKLLNDENLDIALQAASAVWKITDEVESVMPILIKLLDQRYQDRLRYGSCRILAQIGRRAEAAAPLIVNCLHDRELTVRLHASEALWSINGNANLALPGIIEALNFRGTYQRLRAVEILERMGPAAKPAVPALIKRIEDTRTIVTVHDKAIKALKAIDPERAKPFTEKR